MAKKSDLLAGLAPVHPGALLREDILPHVKMSRISPMRWGFPGPSFMPS